MSQQRGHVNNSVVRTFYCSGARSDPNLPYLLDGFEQILFLLAAFQFAYYSEHRIVPVAQQPVL
jgi:hypothetical protein